ncbi:Zinc finger protein [Pseudolycoriella hygida]|uniref:Zinc finger protein n=1 Tax=Pseudolycoriella hygida TaxID=35572 RepID=A0A9Q0NGD6_9DIPT|nr:Zinc finger protein [Pseudolycoriella hygida]
MSLNVLIIANEEGDVPKEASKTQSDEGDGTTSPLNLPLTSSDHDDDESDTDFSDKDETSETKPQSDPSQHEENSSDSFYSASVFTPEEIKKFLLEAPDSEFLVIKAVTVFGISGGCRGEEICNVMLGHVKDTGNIYSSHTSSSFSPSPSEGAETPNSLIHDTENNRLTANIEENGNERAVKKSKLNENCLKSEKTTLVDGVQQNGEGTYHCQFCEKSFPRLGYLKKHEQSHAEHMPFKCDYCARLFKHKRSRDRHTKLHTGDRRYRCPHCEAAFSRSDHLKIHMKTHDNQKPFQCTICNRGYNTAAALTSHMQNHKKQAALVGSSGMNYSPRSTGSGSSTSSIHQKRKYSPTDPNSNIDFISTKRSASVNSTLYCVYCTKNDFHSLDQLHSHIQSMHAAALRENHSPFSSNLQLSCEFCTMKFPTVPTMFHHVRTTHIDRVNSPNTYIDHFNRMTGYGKFAPTLLDRKEDERNVQQTIKTEQPSPRDEKDIEKTVTPIAPAAIKQEEEQDSPTDLSKKAAKESELRSPDPGTKSTPFLCNQCNDSMPDFESFRNHLKNHLNQGVGRFVCQHCGINLTNQADYDRHIASHFLITSSEYFCNFSCNKAFQKSDDLQKHLFEIHAQSLFKCGICSDLFDTKVAIQVHFAVAHSNEVKIYRCSACMEVFKSESDFKHHVKTRHVVSGAVQCVFCRTVCASELEMHFHLAAHARQFRCPACPESFHVEFLLDRHMQTHHSQKDQSYQYKVGSVATANNNNNILDYHYANVGGNKNHYGFNTKFYSSLHVDTPNKPPSSMYGFYDPATKSRYENGGVPVKNLLGIYNPDLSSKMYLPESVVDRDMYQSSAGKTSYFSGNNIPRIPSSKAPDLIKMPSYVPSSEMENKTRPSTDNLLGCGICEKSDFSSEAELHTHRKVAHNLKTGVSLRCAYCNGNFRHELENHMKITHNTTGKHKCLICDEIFPSPAVLAEHKLTHSKVGPSGTCSRCLTALPDVATFKAHMSEHGPVEIPVQCICCRQTLNSEFEIGLHAKFHTKSSDNQENTCALCLDQLPSNTDAKVCEKCFKRHNFSSKFQNYQKPPDQHHPREIEYRCNICKTFVISAVKLQEHLIEHSFKGCEERGYSCYICSSVFTSVSGLQSHMGEHGSGAKPYDCNLCTEKYFFRAELENHMFEHDNGRIKSSSDELSKEMKVENSDERMIVMKSEANDDDEEYIEVEKVLETSMNSRSPVATNGSDDKGDQN